MHSRTESESYPLQRVRYYTRRRILTIIGVASLLVLSLAYIYNHKDDRSLLLTNILPTTPPPEATSLAQTPITNHDQSSTHHSPYTPPSASPNLTTNLIIGTLSSQQSKLVWLSNLTTLTSPPIIYIVDNISAPHHLDTNHGREAAVYLKYIVENYASPLLADITIFWHPDNIAWHNNLLLSLSSTDAINQLNRLAVLRKGYVNARCDSWPGCPAWIAYKPSPAEQILHPGRMADGFSESFFRSKFPNDAPESIPRYFANACCSQFAVSKAAIHSRPVEDYVRLYEWVRDDPFDSLTGRMMEYLWPWIFDKRGSGCEEVVECYCENYGVLCDEGTNGEKENEHQDKNEIYTEGGVGATAGLAEQKALLRNWVDGFRRAEEMGDEAGILIRQEVKKQLTALREAREKVAEKDKADGKMKSKEDREKAKTQLAEQEEGIRKAVAKSVMTTEVYKKIKTDQKEVWQMAREARRRLAELMGLANEAGEQSMRLD